MSDGTKDKENLLGLFSTRASRPKSSQSAENFNQTISSKAISETNLQSSSTSTGFSSKSTVRDGQPRRSQQLSQSAYELMKEVRSELGSDNSRYSGSSNTVDENAIASILDRVVKKRGEVIDDIERAHIILHLQRDLMGWGILQPLIDNKEVTDIHVYDYQTVVLQRGKVSETSGIQWPNEQAYISFLDRLLLRLGKSLTTQQHTVDGSFSNGIRLCAIHQSVCGSRGPLLCIRVPRMTEVALENLVTYQVAPPLIVDYLATLTRSGLATMMIAGETGTGKTTLLKCLGTQFGSDESIVAVEDTPEVNFQHPYFRSLVSRPANAEGQGEVTLQEHIKTTLRMTPTRVILGEMRTPFSAEAFLESAQTGHTGMTTLHARNARETLVRLESLLGRAQKSVSIEIIRQQIALAVDCVVWMVRDKITGKPRVGEVIEVGHFVEGVIQVRPMFKLMNYGDKPTWRIDSWSSGFEKLLAENGIHLGDWPQEFSFGTMLPAKNNKK
jgi:pilus assembly protein CpaF